MTTATLHVQPVRISTSARAKVARRAEERTLIEITRCTTCQRVGTNLDESACPADGTVLGEIRITEGEFAALELIGAITR